LIRFIGFDLKYFGEQCAQIYRQQLRNGEDVLPKALALKELLRNCHPYYAALMHSEFAQIALDCIIEYICSSENKGLEELWVKNLSATDTFGKALFERITDYKTGNAINQWMNLQRMQVYATAKTDLIYGSDEVDISVHKARKLYYDTAFRLTASELGFGIDDLPGVRLSGIPFLPEAPAMMKNAVNTLEPVVREKTEGVEARQPLRGRACVLDQMAGTALNYMINLKRPGIDETLQIIQTYGGLPNTVYKPDSFKSIIDLEFDRLIDKRYCLRAGEKGYTRVRYSSRKEEVPDRPVKPSESPIFVPEEPLPPPPKKKIIPAESILVDLSAPPPEKGEEETPPAKIRHIVADLDKGSTGKVKTIINMAEDPNRRESKKRTLQEVNMRCNLIWTSMNVRSGWSISADEASEWFRYLTRLRYGIGKGQLTPEALDKFLDATLEIYELLPDNV
ncbi:MAG: hypothetical protein GX847_02545, partial [Clostridiales bacterium]|nr:hypothetical protein [Clostridiales bacterium]